MKMTLCLALAFVAAVGFAAAPSLTVTSVSQDAETRLVTISYSLDQDAIVTFESSCGTRVFGDVYRKVRQGNGQLTWYPEGVAAAADAFTLRAWPTDDPPMYFALDLEMPSRQFYYPSVEAMPFAPTSSVCKGQYLVMRRIYAKGIVWPMGSPSTETGRGGGETQHYVKLTNDYYMAIFPMTQGQSRRIIGKHNSSRDVHDLPVDAANWSNIRGKNVSWPEDGHAIDASEDSILKRLRDSTGGLLFDLPTEAEWEYACRAGASGAWNAEGDFGDIAWYAGNNVDDGATNRRGTTKAVGLKRPNAWGLYDMHGNVSEWCLDAFDSYAASTDFNNPVIAPQGPAGKSVAADGNFKRVKRGGGYARSAEKCRSAWRVGLQQSYSLDNVDGNPAALYSNGYRLALPIVPPEE